MIRRCLILICLASQLAGAAEGEIIKVLSHLLDQKGRHTLSPSLFERDAYQAYLRANEDEISAFRFDVQWKAEKTKSDTLILRFELRGSKTEIEKARVFEAEVKRPRFFAGWSSVQLEKDQYLEIGQVLAWRATLWDGEEMIAEQQSFLW